MTASTSAVGPVAMAIPVEPVLELDDIQGIAIPGFFKPHQALLYVTFPQSTAKVVAVRALLRELATERAFASGRRTLDDRREHRRRARQQRLRADRTPLAAIAFSANGLERLTPVVETIPSPAFRGGLASRSALLGDPTDPADPGAPMNWVVGRPGAELDALVVIAGDHARAVGDLAEALAGRLATVGAEVAIEKGDVRPDLPGHEHFGFDDGVSQPGVRGRASDAAEDYITERWLDPALDPDARLFGYPGQDLIWPGELVFGYPASSPDPLIPGRARDCPAWMRNGSFLVYRRLRQDVVAFWRTMRSEAARLRALPGFKDMTAERLAAKLVGRWPSGAPLARSPAGDDSKLGGDALANNDFRFDDDTSRRRGLPAKSTGFFTAKADPVGLVCPVAAHIRKVNVRDEPSDVGGALATRARRLLRVGIPFGTPLADKYGEGDPDPLQGDRGLLFLSIQASIEDQFEFLQARWINNRARPRGPGGHDMIVGQNAVAEDGVRRCHLFGDGLKSDEVTASAQFVIPTGGGYFFVPSLSTLMTLIAPAP